MARRDREEMARLDGMDYALRRIAEIGIEDFRKELAWRNPNKISVTQNPKDIQDALDPYRVKLVTFMITMAVAVLHDQFGFGKKRAAEFRDRFMEKISCINSEYVSLDDYVQMVKEEIGIEVNVR